MFTVYGINIQVNQRQEIVKQKKEVLASLFNDRFSVPDVVSMIFS